MKKDKPQKKKKGRSVQELLGIKTFTKYGLAAGKYELLFYLVSPTNISVLSHTNIEIKIRHLMMVLSAIPDIEITCTDSSECFDDNKSYLNGRLSEEQNPNCLLYTSKQFFIFLGTLLLLSIFILPAIAADAGVGNAVGSRISGCIIGVTE